MSKHTPGPWMVSEKGPFRKQQVPTVYAADSDLRYIAFCADPNEMNTSPTDNLANAYLIAAAPDLLEAIQRLMANHCPLTGIQTHESLVDFWEYEKTQGRGEADDELFALAAIAKANNQKETT